MPKREIRDFYGRVLGTIETDYNGREVARNFYGVILGYYYSDRNYTTDFYGRTIAQGDILASLIEKDANTR